VAAGKNWTTGIFVLNTSAAPAQFSISFYDDNGNPTALPFSTGSTSTLSGTLAAQGSAYYEANNPQIPVITGWGRITSDPSIVVQALFRSSVNGTYYEAAVPSTPASSKEVLFPFDATTFAATGQQLATGFALANLDATSANVTCTAYDPNGVIIPNAVPVPALAPLGHWAGDRFPVLVGQRGTIDCISNTNISATALRFFGNTFSSLPVVTPGLCALNDAACIEAVDTTPLGNRTPLLLIHGWNPSSVPSPPSPEVWDNFINYYNSIPSLTILYKLYRFTYQSNLVSVPDLSRLLRDLLDRLNMNDPKSFGSRQIVIVAHSMGGLISRHFLTMQQFQGAFAGRPGGERVLKVITLATPHHGSPLANGPAMEAAAGIVWGSALSAFNSYFYKSGGPAWNHNNRSDLLWDNYNNLLNYIASPLERNLLLDSLNSTTVYDSKIIAYAGSISPPSSLLACVDLICWGSTVVGGVFGLANDGVVPLISAQFDGHQILTGPQRYFSGYNHYEMVGGKGVANEPLFDRIRQDLLAAGTNQVVMLQENGINPLFPTIPAIRSVGTSPFRISLFRPRPVLSLPAFLGISLQRQPQ
jgi:pimeloyl-ACP methyl ester carboxylesterase